MATRTSLFSLVGVVAAALLFVTCAFVTGVCGANEGDDKPILPPIVGPRHPYERCDRVASKQARSVIENYIQPLLANLENPAIPPSCPLDLEGDMYRLHEDSKTMVSPKKWVCKLCDKSFKSELYLDRHLATRHGDEVFGSGASNDLNKTTCLGDYCDILHCNELATTTEKSSSTPLICNPDSVKRSQLTCYSVIEKCFPIASPLYKDIHNTLTQQFCDNLTCDTKDLEAVKSSRSRGYNILYWITLVIVLLGLGAFYAWVFIQQKEIALANDLQRLGSNRHAARLRMLTSQKSKGY